eukprot:3948091-Prymnesium_polylepis.1
MRSRSAVTPPSGASSLVRSFCLAGLCCVGESLSALTLTCACALGRADLGPGGRNGDSRWELDPAATE